MPTPYGIRTLTLALAASIALPATALADAVLTAKSLEAFAYSSIANWQRRDMRPAGFVEVAEMPGSVFLDIRGVFDVPWSEELARISVQQRDILVVLPDGTELQPFGAYIQLGKMSLLPRAISLNRPREFPEKDADLYYQSLWLIPEGVDKVTFRIGGDVPFEGEVAVPPPTPAPDAASFADFAVNGVRRFRTVKIQDGRPALDLSITAPQGKLLAEIRVNVTGKESNDFAEEPRFYWYTHSFRLVDGDGNTMGLIGERFNKAILGWQYNGIAVGQSAERTVIWGVPEGLETATLLYGETPVAEIALAGAAVAETD